MLVNVLGGSFLLKSSQYTETWRRNLFFTFLVCCWLAPRFIVEWSFGLKPLHETLGGTMR